jgi:hypothetical protein
VIALDVALVVLILLGAGWGLWRGALRQILDTTVWVATFVVPGFLAGPLAHRLEKPLSVPFPVAYLFSVVALGLLTQIVTRLLFHQIQAWWATRQRLKTIQAKPKKKGEPAPAPTPNGLDGVLGALLGAGKVGILVWVGLSFLVVVDQRLAKEGLHLKAEQSSLFQLAAANNALGLFFGPALHKLDLALQRKGRWQELLRDDRFAAVARDPTLLKALQTGDVRALDRSPALLSIVTDEGALQKVDAVLEEKAPVARPASAATR